MYKSKKGKQKFSLFSYQGHENIELILTIARVKSQFYVESLRKNIKIQKQLVAVAETFSDKKILFLFEEFRSRP